MEYAIKKFGKIYSERYTSRVTAEKVLQYLYGSNSCATVVEVQTAEPCAHVGITTPDGHGAYCQYCGETIA